MYYTNSTANLIVKKKKKKLVLLIFMYAQGKGMSCIKHILLYKSHVQLL